MFRIIAPFGFAFIAAGLMASDEVWAEEPDSGPQVEAIGTCDGESCTGVYIQRLFVSNSAGYVSIDTTGDEEGLDNCTPTAYLQLPMSGPRSKEVYSLLLSSFMADKKLRLRMVDGSNPCQVLYVTLDRQ